MLWLKEQSLCCGIFILTCNMMEGIWPCTMMFPDTPGEWQLGVLLCKRPMPRTPSLSWLKRSIMSIAGEGRVLLYFTWPIAWRGYMSAGAGVAEGRATGNG